ncbi:MAG TPA: hypothetical protein VND64_19600 [Pirellulales bacterium]|nr:hypothetical protein [Pirellulales bacterium]
MKNFLLVLAFTGLTALCWGVYGPVLRHGVEDMGHLRPFICVGVAYFVIAIVVPGVLLRLYGEKGNWTGQGMIWSLEAGAAGAVGALGIILALELDNRGAVYVMPLVFGCAPVVNTFYTILSSKGQLKPGPVFIAGLILVAAGAVTVLVFKPSPAKSAAPLAKNSAEAENSAAEKEKPKTETAASKDSASAHGPTERLSAKEMTLITLFVAMTALCWGVYGPVLHKGQMLMQGSRLRPLICVGVAYFAIAVVVPFLILQTVGEHIQTPGKSPEFTFNGSLWSLAGGAAGAVGALGIIMAFNFGGKPVYVMPLVFGCAPVINTFVSVAGKAVGEISPLFYAGLIIVVAGAVTVLVFAPKAGHGPPANPAAKPKTAEQPA